MASNDTAKKAKHDLDVHSIWFITSFLHLGKEEMTVLSDRLILHVVSLYTMQLLSVNPFNFLGNSFPLAIEKKQ